MVEQTEAEGGSEEAVHLAHLVQCREPPGGELAVDQAGAGGGPDGQSAVLVADEAERPVVAHALVEIGADSGR